MPFSLLSPLLEKKHRCFGTGEGKRYFYSATTMPPLPSLLNLLDLFTHRVNEIIQNIKCLTKLTSKDYTTLLETCQMPFFAAQSSSEKNTDALAPAKAKGIFIPLLQCPPCLPSLTCWIFSLRVNEIIQKQQLHNQAYVKRLYHKFFHLSRAKALISTKSANF